MFGVEKHLMVLIAQLYYKYTLLIITHFIQEIQRSDQILKKKN